jgi:hypothetical protein
MRVLVLATAGLASSAALAGCRDHFDPLSTTDGSPADGTQEEPLPPVLRGCELYLRFEEDSLGARGAGAARDRCGEDDPATSRNAITAVDPTRGRVAYFDGASEMTVPDSPRLRGIDSISLSAWIKPSGTVGQPPGGILAKRVSFGVKSAYTMFLWTGGHMWGDIDLEDQRFDVPVVVEPDRWVHLAMVYDGNAAFESRIRTYINGAHVGTFPEASERIPDSYDAPLHIGYLPDATDPNLYFKGMIDDVVIWNRALGDTEVDDWYRLSKR